MTPLLHSLKLSDGWDIAARCSQVAGHMSLLRRGTCCTGVSDILEEICSAGSQAHGRALALALRTAGDTAADFSPALLLLRNFEALASSALGDPAHSGEDCPSIMALLVPCTPRAPWRSFTQVSSHAACVPSSPLRLASRQYSCLDECTACCSMTSRQLPVARVVPARQKRIAAGHDA